MHCLKLLRHYGQLSNDSMWSVFVNYICLEKSTSVKSLAAYLATIPHWSIVTRKAMWKDCMQAETEGPTYPQASVIPSDNIRNILLLGGTSKNYQRVDVIPLSPHLFITSPPFSGSELSSAGRWLISILGGIGDRCSLIHPAEVGQSVKFIFIPIYSISLLSLTFSVAFVSVFSIVLNSYSDNFWIVCTSHFLDLVSHIDYQ